MRFRFYRLRLRFTAIEAIAFPAGSPANILRGAFGSIFRRLTCAPECVDARTCPRRASCAYARTYEPSAISPGPSGLKDWPRPFVFRASHLDGRLIQPFESFEFDVHLFDIHELAADAFIKTFGELAKEGLGPGRGRATLTDSDCELMMVKLTAPTAPIDRLTIRFLTPTELKSYDGIAVTPEFGILMARVRDRIGTLSALYGDGPLDLDYAGFGRRAETVKMVDCVIHRVEASRRSSRTGQRHPLSGFTGEASYAGTLTEFRPFLEAAQYAGIGRQTTWGKGEISLIDAEGPR